MERPTKRRVVICGITGAQGGHVYSALKDDEEYELVGFSRTLDECNGLTLRRGDLSDLDSLRRIFRDADYVFGLTQPWSADYARVDPAGEIVQGGNIIEACIDCKVRHLVFSTSAHDGVKSGIPHVDSKIEIEDRLKASGLNHTILRPVQFADNIGSPFFPIKHTGWIQGFVDGDVTVPYVCCRDIGQTTRAVLKNDPVTNFNGKSIKLIGDLVSGEDLAAIVSKLRKGQNFAYYPVPRLLLRLFAKEFYLMRIRFEKFGRDKQEVAEAKEDIECLKRLVPDLSSVQDHLTREGWATRELISKDELERIEKIKKLALVAVTTVGGVAAYSFRHFQSSKGSLRLF